MRIDLRTVGQNQGEFDRIIALAADPGTYRE
jgi:alpha/beta superfamily hydrolase